MIKTPRADGGQDQRRALFHLRARPRPSRPLTLRTDWSPRHPFPWRGLRRAQRGGVFTVTDVSARLSACRKVSQLWALKPRSITAPERMSTLIAEYRRWVAAFFGMPSEA